MMHNNRLNYWRHQLLFDHQKDFAEWLGVTQSQINLWEKQRQQPNLETLIRLWQRLRERIPDINLQDLIDLED